MVEALFDKGWAHFPAEDSLLDWVQEARRLAHERISDPDEQAKWLQCEGTWFVGVDTLPNDETGAIGQAGPLPGAAIAAARDIYGDLPLHSGQVSVTYPGYPKPRHGESEAAFRYRLKRDAAHVDGLLAVGEARQRMLRERHAYILGLPLTTTSPGASPFVIWEGSHRIMQAMFADHLGPHPESDWANIDLTEAYKTTRREVFETCKRIEICAQPGEAYLVHRMALHGVAPWAADAKAPPEGRMIAYFRPELPLGARDWLSLR
jgi:hypothetical protein